MSRAKLITKPWNDPWNRAAERDPKYRKHQCGGARRSDRLSWRQIKAISRAIECGRPLQGNTQRRVWRALGVSFGRRELISSAAERARADRCDPMDR